MSTVHSEMRVTASVGGRSLDRASVTTGHTDMPVRFHRAESTIFCGFQMSWVDGEDPESGVSFSLTAGAETGSRYMVLTVELPGGRTVQEYVDVTEFVTERVTAIMNEVTS